MFTNLSIDQNQLQDAIKITPNPVHEKLNISISNKTVKSVIIFDVLSKKIKDISYNFDQVDVSNLQNGLYILKIETENGENQIFKVIKE